MDQPMRSVVSQTTQRNHAVSIIFLVLALLHVIAPISAWGYKPSSEEDEARAAAILNDPLLDPFLAHRRPLNDQELGFLLGKDPARDLQETRRNVTWLDLQLAAERSVASSTTINLPYSHIGVTSHDSFGIRVDLSVDLFESTGLCQFAVRTSLQTSGLSGASEERYLGYFIAVSATDITLYLTIDNEQTPPVTLRAVRRANYIPRNVKKGRSETPQVFAVSLTEFVRVMQLRQLPLKLTATAMVQEADVVQRLSVLSDWRNMAYWRSTAKPPPTWFNCTSTRFFPSSDFWCEGDTKYKSILSTSTPCSTRVSWLSKRLTLCPNGLAELLVEEEVLLSCPGYRSDTPRLRLLGTFSVDSEGIAHLSLGGPHPSEMCNGSISLLMSHTSYPYNGSAIETCTAKRCQQLYDAFDGDVDKSDGGLGAGDTAETDDAGTAALAELRRREDEEDSHRREENRAKGQVILKKLLSTLAFVSVTDRQRNADTLNPEDVAAAFAAGESNNADALRRLLLRHGGGVWIDVERGSIRETLAHVAAGKGSCAALRELIRAKAVNFSRRNLLGETALFLAVEQSHVECAEALLSAMPASAANWAILDETVYGWSPAYVAASVNNDATLLSVILKVATIDSLNALSSRNRTLLYESAVRGSSAAVELLLASGASREAVSTQTKSTSFPETSWEETAVVGAMRAGQQEPALAMIQGGAFPSREYTTTRSLTPTIVPPLNLSLYPGLLHEAAAACHEIAVEALLADITNESFSVLETVPYLIQSRRIMAFGDTPLTAVTLCSDPDAALQIARLFLQRGASVQCSADRCPLVEAISHRHRQLRAHETCLVSQIYDCTARCRTPELPDLVDLFLENHADVNGVDALGRSPIAVASNEPGQLSLIQELLARGANPRVGVARPSRVEPALSAYQVVAARKDVELLKLLFAAEDSLAAGAEPKSIPTRSEAQRHDVVPRNWPLLHAAITVSQCWTLEEDGRITEVERIPEILALLLERRRHELNFSAVDDEGNSILMVAVRCPTPTMLQVTEKLISLGADVNQGNHRGETPLFVAASKSSSDSIPFLRLLLRRGANASAPDLEGRLALHAVIEESRPLQRLVDDPRELNASTMVEVLELLLNASPQSVHQPAPNGLSPLALVVLRKGIHCDTKYEAARTLLSYGASATKDHWKGQTLVERAVHTNAIRKWRYDLQVEDRLIDLLRRS